MATKLSHCEELKQPRYAPSLAAARLGGFSPTIGRTAIQLTAAADIPGLRPASLLQSICRPLPVSRLIGQPEFGRQTPDSLTQLKVEPHQLVKARERVSFGQRLLRYRRQLSSDSPGEYDCSAELHQDRVRLTRKPVRRHPAHDAAPLLGLISLQFRRGWWPFTRDDRQDHRGVCRRPATLAHILTPNRPEHYFTLTPPSLPNSPVGPNGAKGP